MKFAFVPQNADQGRILADGFLTDRRSGTLILPTGSGKSRLVWVAMLHQIERQGKAIYLAPTKAVLMEQYRSWQAYIEQTVAASQSELMWQNSPSEPPEGAGRYSIDLLSLSRVPVVGLFDGDHAGSAAEYRETDILLMTPEKLDLALRHRGIWSKQSWIQAVGVCVIDEVQLLGEGHRGARLEGTLTRLRLVNPECCWIALSADLRPDDAALLNWIGEYTYHSNLRAVPQRWRLLTYRSGVERERLLVNLLEDSGYLSLVFVSSRKRVAQVGRLLGRAGLQVQVHHAGRSEEQRQTAEQQFKERVVQVLVATSSLAVGVNLPARQVVVYDLYKYVDGNNGVQQQRVTVGELSQMGGRAGRPGLDVQGNVVVIAHCQDAQWVRQIMPQTDRLGNLIPAERMPVLSVLLQSKAWLAEQVLALIVGGYATSGAEAFRIISEQSLAVRQGQQVGLEQIERLCGALHHSGLIQWEEQGGRLRTEPDDGIGVDKADRSLQNVQNRLSPTALGQTCSRQYLMPAVAVKWSITLGEVARLNETPTVWDWLALVGLTSGIRLLGRRLQMQRIGWRIPSYWQQAGVAGERLHCTGVAAEPTADHDLLYRHAALLLQHNTVNGDLNQLLAWAGQAGERGLYGADVQAAVDQAVRSLEALVGVALALEQVDLHNAVGRLRVLVQRLKTGLSGQTVSLTLLEGIGVKRATALRRAGIDSIAAIATAEVETLSQIKGISKPRAVAIIQQARQLMQDIKMEWFED